MTDVPEAGQQSQYLKKNVMLLMINTIRYVNQPHMTEQKKRCR